MVQLASTLTIVEGVSVNALGILIGVVVLAAFWVAAYRVQRLLNGRARDRLPLVVGVVLFLCWIGIGAGLAVGGALGLDPAGLWIFAYAGAIGPFASFVFIRKVDSGAGADPAA
jgi:small-conductance mechanosensitive channel